MFRISHLSNNLVAYLAEESTRNFVQLTVKPFDLRCDQRFVEAFTDICDFVVDDSERQVLNSAADSEVQANTSNQWNQGCDEKHAKKFRNVIASTGTV